MAEFQDPVAAVRAQLNAEMMHVMDHTQPTPTQAELDAANLGLHDQVAPRDAPRMRPAEEQQRMIADAEEDRAGILRDRFEQEARGEPAARQPTAQDDAARRQQEQDQQNREAARRQAAARAQTPPQQHA